MEKSYQGEIMKTKAFAVSGIMQVQGRPVKDADGCVIGYKQKDGSIIRLVVALEVENKEGTKLKYLTTDKQWAPTGFSIDGYNHSEFYDPLWRSGLQVK
jgi:hypothetical protein